MTIKYHSHILKGQNSIVNFTPEMRHVYYYHVLGVLTKVSYSNKFDNLNNRSVELMSSHIEYALSIIVSAIIDRYRYIKCKLFLPESSHNPGGYVSVQFRSDLSESEICNLRNQPSINK